MCDTKENIPISFIKKEMEKYASDDDYISFANVFVLRKLISDWNAYIKTDKKGNQER